MSKEKKPMNDKPLVFDAMSSDIRFTHPRSDFSGQAVEVDLKGDKTINEYSQAVAELMFYFTQEVWPNLNGFQGLEGLKFSLSGGRIIL